MSANLSPEPFTHGAGACSNLTVSKASVPASRLQAVGAEVHHSPLITPKPMIQQTTHMQSTDRQVTAKHVTTNQIRPTVALNAMVGFLPQLTWSVVLRGNDDGNQREQQASVGDSGYNPQAMDSVAIPPDVANAEPMAATAAIATEPQVSTAKLSVANLKVHEHALGRSRLRKNCPANIIVPPSLDSSRSSSRTRTPEAPLFLLHQQNATMPPYVAHCSGHGRWSGCSSRTRSAESVTRVPSTWSAETLVFP